MKIIKIIIDLWTDQHYNHYECFNVDFVDGFEDNKVPFNTYKVIKNCYCLITVISPIVKINNKHNDIIFLQREHTLVVINKNTDIDKCIHMALEQHFEKSILKKYMLLRINQKMYRSKLQRTTMFG